MEEGYKVRYPDGYESFSPKAVFEAAYRPIDSMNFGLAIEAMKKGQKCRRAGWNGKNQHIELASAISYTSPAGTIVNAEHAAIGNKAIAFCALPACKLDACKPSGYAGRRLGNRGVKEGAHHGYYDHH